MGVLRPVSRAPGRLVLAVLVAATLAGCGMNRAVTTLPNAADDLRDQTRGFFPDRDEDGEDDPAA